MSSRIDLNYSANFSYGPNPYGEAYAVALHSPRTLDAEHAETVQMVAGMMQAVYDLAGDLRGFGPTAHKLLRQRGEPSLRERVAAVMTALEDLQSDLAAGRDQALHRQLFALGIDEHSRNLNIHIGCGGHVLPGWINLDNYPAPLAVNLDWGLPLPDNSAKHVFVSHLLEHLFYPAQSHRLLDEIHRVLEPGGIVRIVVPDIEQCLRAYANNDTEFFAARRKHWSWLPSDITHLESFLAYAGAGPTPEHLFEHHKFGYDFETLKRCLERAGFSDIKRCAYQSSAHERLRVDHASENAAAEHDNGHFSLFVEATPNPR